MLSIHARIGQPFRYLVVIAAFGFWAIGTRTTSDANEPSVLVSRTQPLNTVLFPTGDTWQKGLHLLEATGESLVMGRDGWLHTIAKNEAVPQLQKIDEPFQVASATEMRNQLRSEFGPKFDVVATQNFLVVQPKGRGNRWPDMFEQSHRTFVDTMRRRGVSVRQGRFPMVAIVMPDARAMYAEFERLNLDVARVSGLYSNRCNRVITHDGGQFELIATTVRHEAAHQSAFNTGVHSRVNDTPSWVTEGIGQLFEPTAWSSPSPSNLADRVNRESMEQLRKSVDLQDAVATATMIDSLIATDDMFKDSGSIHSAYAMSWAMVFYLAERQPKEFADMLNFTATRPPFETYRPGQRRIDFERIVGADTATFSTRVAKFLTTLP